MDMSMQGHIQYSAHETADIIDIKLYDSTTFEKEPCFVISGCTAH